nr:MAG TPA: hypothetical protein [Caudoviricetes sp.]
MSNKYPLISEYFYPAIHFGSPTNRMFTLAATPLII